MAKTTWNLSFGYALGFPASLLLGMQHRGVFIRLAEALLRGTLLHTKLGASSRCISEAVFTHGDHLVCATMPIQIKYCHQSLLACC